MALGTSARDFVTILDPVQASGLGVTYTLAGTSEAGARARGTRTLTLTFTGGT